MRLNKSQKKQLLEWVAEGLKTDEINERAASYPQPFKVSREQARFYRVTRGVRLKDLAEADEYNALTQGLSIRAERVRRLHMLAGLMEEDLFSGSHWVTDVKNAGGEMVEVERFNAAEVSEYRATLDDIAREMGDRKTNVKVGGDRDNPLEVTHFYIPDNGRGGPRP